MTRNPDDLSNEELVRFARMLTELNLITESSNAEYAEIAELMSNPPEKPDLAYINKCIDALKAHQERWAKPNKILDANFEAIEGMINSDDDEGPKKIEN